MSARIEVAKALSKLYHKGQTYGSGNLDYFEHHVQGVVNSLLVHDLEEDIIIAAYLHDVVEDTDIKPETILDLFGETVYEAVLALTYKAFDKNETRETYLKRCATNKIARFVKLHDASFNMTSCLINKNNSRANYYANTLSQLGLIK